MKYKGYTIIHERAPMDGDWWSAVGYTDKGYISVSSLNHEDPVKELKRLIDEVPKM